MARDVDFDRYWHNQRFFSADRDDLALRLYFLVSLWRYAKITLSDYNDDFAGVLFRSSDDDLKNENSCLMLVIYVPFTAIGENRQAFGGQTAYLHPRGVIYRSNESDNCYMSLLCILFHSRQRNEWTLTRRTSPGMMTSLLLRLSGACRVKTILDLNYTKYVLLTTLESGSKYTVYSG